MTNADRMRSMSDNSDWISVKDRLPDYPGRYLVVKKRIAPEDLGGNRKDVTILRFTADRNFRMPVHFPEWINDEMNESVTHWMPLPGLPLPGLPEEENATSR